MTNPNFILSCGNEAFRVSGIEDLDYTTKLGTGPALVNALDTERNLHVYRDLIPKLSNTLVLLEPEAFDLYKFKKVCTIRTYGKYLSLQDVCLVFNMGKPRAMKKLFLRYYQVKRSSEKSMKTSPIYIDYDGFKDSDWIKYSPNFEAILEKIETNLITSKKVRSS